MPGSEILKAGINMLYIAGKKSRFAGTESLLSARSLTADKCVDHKLALGIVSDDIGDDRAGQIFTFHGRLWELTSLPCIDKVSVSGVLLLGHRNNDLRIHL